MTLWIVPIPKKRPVWYLYGWTDSPIWNAMMSCIQQTTVNFLRGWDWENFRKWPIAHYET